MMTCSILCSLFLLLSLHFYSAASDCTALLNFVDSFTITEEASRDFCYQERTNSYPKTSSWKNGTDCCSWDGVTCGNVGSSKVVIGLDLSCSWLQGDFLANSTLFSLRHLRRLNLGGNNFIDSQIPTTFREFPDMTHLNLSGSSFTGLIPQEVAHLVKLESLDLSHGEFILPLVLQEKVLKSMVSNLTRLRNLVLDHTDMSQASPNNSFTNFSSSLNYLSLADCSLDGFRVSHLFRLPQLQFLYLSGNMGFSDILSSSNWTSPLLALDLSATLSEGKLLEKIVTLKTLQYLNLQSNLIDGEIPASIGNMTELGYLDLSATHICGSLPLTLANLEQLSYLGIMYNDNMTGVVDFEIFAKMRKMRTLLFPPQKLNVVVQDGGNGSFPELKDLKLSGCNLTKFPYFLSSSKGLQYLDLSQNMIAGPIPRWLWSLGNDTLEELFLSDNLITGALRPLPWKKMTHLEIQNNLLDGELQLLPSATHEFHAYNNGFTGAIPVSVCQLSDLGLLFLSDNQLSGTIPGCISNLTMLEALDVSSNHLQGPLPRSISNCSLLVNFDIGHNRINDTFPDWFQPNTLWNLDLQSKDFHGPVRLGDRIPFVEITAYNLADNAFTGHWPTNYFLNSTDALYLLDLSNNNFVGPIPIPPPDIQYYAVSDNKFTGEIPSAICDAPGLMVADLSNNSLVGSIPHCLAQINASLTVLNLRKNKLIGEIPQIFVKNNRLRTFDLSQNNLHGVIPKSLANCKDLEVLDLSNNAIEDLFPSWLAALPKLQVLVIRSNRFYGPVKNDSDEIAIHPFHQLRIFDISVNRFEGPLPVQYMANFAAMVDYSEQGSLQFVSDTGYKYQDSIRVIMKGSEIELVRILKVFTTIDLSANFFDGEFPSVVGNLRALKGINFSHNEITGSISPTIRNLSNLEWLDLSSNNLSGEIPPAMADLTYLAYLNLSGNQLSGPIPTGNQFNTFGGEAYEGNPGLCGFPLLKACGLNDDGDHSSSFDEEDDDDQWMEWVAVPVGYVFGIVFGFSVGYIFLENRRRK